MGPCKVIPQEFSNIRVRNIDVALPKSDISNEESLLDSLEAEIGVERNTAVVAYRGDYCWLESLEPVQLEASNSTIPPLRENGVYLLVGGLGGIGLELAEFLAGAVKAKLVLTGRSSFPDEEEWDHLLGQNETSEDVAYKLRKIQSIKALGGEVMIASADISDLDAMARVVN